MDANAGQPSVDVLLAHKHRSMDVMRRSYAVLNAIRRRHPDEVPADLMRSLREMVWPGSTTGEDGIDADDQDRPGA